MTDTFLDDVLSGLSGKQKTLPCKYFYDAIGAKLFDAITTVDEYYPTRTELSILRDHGAAIAAKIGSHARIVEVGSGEGEKTPLLLASLDAPTAYSPVDISAEQLAEVAARLTARFPTIAVTPVAADYTKAFHLPAAPKGTARTVAYFAGSTIGNFEPIDGARFLATLRDLVGGGGAILLGVDRAKDRAVLEAAYDDAEGITARFNKNLLVRINRELGADFDVDAFAHRAVWHRDQGRIEMQLVSPRPQTVTIGAAKFGFAEGEFIVTEHCHKYDDVALATLVDRAGLRVEASFRDARDWFGLELLVAKDRR